MQAFDAAARQGMGAQERGYLAERTAILVEPHEEVQAPGHVAVLGVEQLQPEAVRIFFLGQARAS